MHSGAFCRAMDLWRNSSPRSARPFPTASANGSPAREVAVLDPMAVHWPGWHGAGGKSRGLRIVLRERLFSEKNDVLAHATRGHGCSSKVCVEARDFQRSDWHRSWLAGACFFLAFLLPIPKMPVTKRCLQELQVPTLACPNNIKQLSPFDCLLNVKFVLVYRAVRGQHLSRKRCEDGDPFLEDICFVLWESISPSWISISSSATPSAHSTPDLPTLVRLVLAKLAACGKNANIYAYMEVDPKVLDVEENHTKSLAPTNRAK